MEEKQVATMVIKVDLDCEKCQKKIKKVLCKLPQIQNQIYDKKANTVTITVVCCSPEKIKQKICCKGGETIKGIEIKVPEKPKQPEKPEKPKQPEKPKEPEKPKQPEKPKEPEKPKQPEKPKEPEKPKQPEKPKEPEKPKVVIVEPPKPKVPEPTPKPAPVQQAPEPVPGYPPVPVYPRTCCSECYEGYGGGPCYHDYGRPPASCYEPYGRPVYDSWGGSGGCNCRRRGYYVCKCEYICEDNPSSCTIM